MVAFHHDMVEDGVASPSSYNCTSSSVKALVKNGPKPTSHHLDLRSKFQSRRNTGAKGHRLALRIYAPWMPTLIPMRGEVRVGVKVLGSGRQRRFFGGMSKNVLRRWWPNFGAGEVRVGIGGRQHRSARKKGETCLDEDDLSQQERSVPSMDIGLFFVYVLVGLGPPCWSVCLCVERGMELLVAGHRPLQQLDIGPWRGGDERLRMLLGPS